MAIGWLSLASVVGGGVKALAGPVTEWVKGKQRIKAAKVDAEIQVIQARADHVQYMATTDQAAGINWEKASIENAGWKDEFLLLLFSIPLVMCFVPGGSPYVREGFSALNECPEWYRWSICIMVGSAYGYRKIADRFTKK